MYLISQFHDYYDTVLKQGIDKSIIYKREEKEIYIPQNSFLKEYTNIIPRIYSWSLVQSCKIDATPFLVGICGKIYVGYEIQGTHEKREFVYSCEDIIQYFYRSKKEEDLKIFLKPKVKHEFKIFSPPFRKYTVEPIFEQFKTDAKLCELFTTYQVPIFLIELKKYPIYTNSEIGKIILNPCLKNYNFQTQLDPYTIFQEISMYISGVLGTGSPDITIISDKEMAQKKGFDNLSFKTISPGKKYNRRIK